MKRVVWELLNSRAGKFVVDFRTFATRKTSCVAFRGGYLRDRYKLGMDRFFAEHNPAARTRLVHHMLDAIKCGDRRRDRDAGGRAVVRVRGRCDKGIHNRAPATCAGRSGANSEHACSEWSIRFRKGLRLRACPPAQ